jgi:hypothetical protein
MVLHDGVILGNPRQRTLLHGILGALPETSLGELNWFCPIDKKMTIQQEFKDSTSRQQGLGHSTEIPTSISND